MKRTLYIFVCAVLAVSMFAGLCAAYPDAEPAAEPRAITYYSFYLSLSDHGLTDLATSRVKELDVPSASYSLTLITNQTGYPCYVNVRNKAGTAMAGIAHTIYNNQTGPMSFGVKYKSGYGNAGVFYRPSGQTSSSSPYGAYVQGEWHP